LCIVLYCIVLIIRLADISAPLQGYDWVGWSNDSSAVLASSGVVQLTFQFDAVRNFTSTRLRANNMRSRDVAAFRRAVPSVSLDGRSYASLDAVLTPAPDQSQSAGDVVLPLGGAVGRFVRLRLEFAAHWMLLSEVEFTSGLYTAADLLRCSCCHISSQNDEYRRRFSAQCLYLIIHIHGLLRRYNDNVPVCQQLCIGMFLRSKIKGQGADPRI